MKQAFKILTAAIFVFVFFGAALAQSNKFSGTVTYGDKSPLHNATVQIVQLRQTAETDENGVFEFAGVPAGRYTILVHMEGFTDRTEIVEIPASGAVERSYRLEISALREQVTVTASGTEQSVFDSFQSVNSVGQTRITEKGATSLGEVLENETGVAKRSFGPGTSRPVIRGFDGDRVLVLQNGVRSGSIGSQSGDHGEPVDPLAAERIEVVKGPGTLLYGSNALGGVVNVVGTDENERHAGFRGYLTALGGTADRQGAFSGGLEYGYRNWIFRGSGSFQRTGDYDTPLGRVQNSAALANSGSFGAGYYGDKAYLSGTFSLDRRRYGVPFAALFHEHEDDDDHDHEEAFSVGAFSSFVPPVLDEEIDLRLRRNNFRLSGGFRNLNNRFVSGIRYNLDYVDYRHEELEILDGADEIGTIFDNRTFSYRTLFEQTKYKKLTGRFGFEGFTRDYEVNGEEQLIQGKIKHNSFSAFTLQELAFERVKFQFGGRLETNRFSPDNADLPGRNFTGFSGGAGVNFALWTGGAFVVNYTNSYRAPSLEELYNNGPHIGNVTFEIGNRNLRNELANGLDFSLRHLSNRVRITGDVYYYNIRDYVFLAYQDENGDGAVDIADGLPAARYEQANARYFGAELSADVTIKDWLGAFLNLDATRARLVDRDLDLPRIPPARARVGLDFRYGGLSVRPEAVFAARQDRVYPLETPTAGYGIFNVAASYTVGRRHFAHIFSVNAHNLTDKLYRNHLSFIKNFAPEVGRGVRFGYTLRFF